MAFGGGFSRLCRLDGRSLGRWLGSARRRYHHGARKSKFIADGRVTPMPGSNLPLATLGTFILWMGWFGFNGGSQLAMGLAADAVPMLGKLKIDDVVGAIPVHLVCGIWGTIAVVFSNSDAKLGIQVLGILAVGAFVFFASLIVWLVIKMTIGVRPSDEDEVLGLDRAECGMEAYPDFSR